MEDDILSMRDLKQPAHLLSPWLRRGSIAMLHARPGTKKTYFGLAIALAVGLGDELLGWHPDRPDKHRRVLYLDAEMPLWLLRKRLKQLGGGKGANVTFLSRETQLLRGLTMPDLGSTEGQDELEALINYVEPDLVVLDSLSALIRSGAENEREPWLPIEEWLQRQRACQRAMLMIHHQGKSGLQRGTSAREEVCDAIMSIRKEDNDVLRLTFEKLRDHDGPFDASMKLRLSIDDKSAQWNRVAPRKGEPGHTRARVRALRGQGKNKSQIARTLNIDRKTVHAHLVAS